MRASYFATALMLCLSSCDRLDNGGSTQQAVSTQPAEQRTADDGPIQPADTVSADDLKILDTVLSHWAADPEFQKAKPIRSGQHLIVHTSTLGGNAYVRAHQVYADSHEGNLPRDAVSDSECRNNGPLVQISGRPFSSVRRAAAPLTGWSPTSPNVVLDDLDRFPRVPMSSAYEDALKKAHPNAMASVRAALPGYSKDGRQAVVRLDFDPTPHGAMATYHVTKNRAGSWTIKWWPSPRTVGAA